MTRNEVYKELTSLSERIFNVECQLSEIINLFNAQRKEEIEAITPYTETQTAYIGDTEKIFYTDMQGNLTVFFPYEYTVERLTDRIIITFNPLEEVTDITISIL